MTSIYHPYSWISDWTENNNVSADKWEQSALQKLKYFNDISLFVQVFHKLHFLSAVKRLATNQDIFCNWPRARKISFFSRSFFYVRTANETAHRRFNRQLTQKLILQTNSIICPLNSE